MKTLTDLANEMDALAESLPSQLNQAKIEVAEAILQDLSQVTPADVGAAISNWQVTLEAPASAEILAHVPSPSGRMIRGVWVHSVPPETTRAANAPVTFDVGRQTIIQAKPGQSIWITNVLPYIKRLNDGSSKQAPSGFVDRAIILYRLVIDKFKVLR